MTVREIVTVYLRDNKYDGLYYPSCCIEDSCACKIDNLIPCDEMEIEYCRAGYLKECNCGCHDWHIAENK